MPNHFMRTNKKVYIMGKWESHTALHSNILKAGDTDLITIRGDVITLRCANGRASYRLQSFDRNSQTYVAELVEASYEPPPAHLRASMN